MKNVVIGKLMDHLEYIIGSVITEKGPQPFVLHTKTGKLELGTYAEPDPAQNDLSVIQQQRFAQLIEERTSVGFSQVRLGQYHCSECGQWVDALSGQWSLSVCLSCSMDRASELAERYAKEEPVVAEEEAGVAEEEEPVVAEEEPVIAEEEAVLAEESVEIVVEIVGEIVGEEKEQGVAVDKQEEEADELEEGVEIQTVEEANATEPIQSPADTFIDAVLLPTDAEMLEKALRIAVEAHSGQRDKAGSPYILHPLRMMLHLRTPAEMMAAVLHDVVEDTGWTLDGLRSEGFSDEVLEAVDGLTRREEETYEAFIERAAQHPVARRVKLADLEDNMDIRRLESLTAKDKKRLVRYQKAWHQLQKAES